MKDDHNTCHAQPLRVTSVVEMLMLIRMSELKIEEKF